jgi:hypothetical protein
MRHATTASLVATLAVAFSATACSDSGGADRYADAFPLFGDLTEESFDAACRAFRAKQELDKTLQTVAPPEINWAPDIYAAIERATAEDKPIFLSTHVDLNAQGERDV